MQQALQKNDGAATNNPVKHPVANPPNISLNEPVVKGKSSGLIIKKLPHVQTTKISTPRVTPHLIDGSKALITPTLNSVVDITLSVTKLAVVTTENNHSVKVSPIILPNALPYRALVSIVSGRATIETNKPRTTNNATDASF